MLMSDAELSVRCQTASPVSLRQAHGCLRDTDPLGATSLPERATVPRHKTEMVSFWGRWSESVQSKEVLCCAV